MDSFSQLQANNLGCIRQQKPLFANISFQLHSGEMLLIQGPNGSGKSSLLRLLTGLSTPFEGEILWYHEDIQKHLSAYWNNLHYIGHTNGIKPGLTVHENLKLAGHLRLTASPGNLSTILTQLQLHNHQQTLARFLSAGQKRRLALAKLFLFPRPLWILDEPLTALDANTQTFFLSCLEEHLHNSGIAIVSSHHPIHFNKAIVKSLRLELC
jgi:heme exporter protein A